MKIVFFSSFWGISHFFGAFFSLSRISFHWVFSTFLLLCIYHSDIFPNFPYFIYFFFLNFAHTSRFHFGSETKCGRAIIIIAFFCDVAIIWIHLLFFFSVYSFIFIFHLFSFDERETVELRTLIFKYFVGASCLAILFLFKFFLPVPYVPKAQGDNHSPLISVICLQYHTCVNQFHSINVLISIPIKLILVDFIAIIASYSTAKKTQWQSVSMNEQKQQKNPNQKKLCGVKWGRNRFYYAVFFKKKKKHPNERTAIKLMQHMFVTVDAWMLYEWGCLDSELDFFPFSITYDPRSLSHVQMD